MRSRLLSKPSAFNIRILNFLVEITGYITQNTTKSWAKNTFKIFLHFLVFLDKIKTVAFAAYEKIASYGDPPRRSALAQLRHSKN
jgi:hypothetical protein